MNACDRIDMELSALIDGELDVPTERAVLAHVEACARCAATLDRLRAVGAVLRRWDADETRYAATSAFRSRVLQRVGGASAGRRPAAARRLRLVGGPFRWAAAALLFVAVGASLYAVWPRVTGPDDADLVDAVYARLLERMEQERRSAGEPVALPEPAPFEVARLRPWETVVTPEEDTADASGSAIATRSDLWEEHGDSRVLRDAFPEYDRFQRERRDAGLLEEFRRLQATASAAPDDRPTTDVGTVTVLGKHLGGLDVAEGYAASFERVQVWPIVRRGGLASDGAGELLTADDALATKVLRVRDGGQDGTLIVENRDRRGREILLVAGDVFSGARRDQIVAEDVVLAPGQSRSVRAIATGDARRSSRRTYSRSDGLAPQRVRALLARGADSAAVEAVVDACLPWLGSAGGNGSVNAVFGNDQLLSRADRYVDAFRGRLDDDHVVGFAFAAGRDLLGIEVFADHDTFVAARQRVLRSYVLEALARPRLIGRPPGRDVAVAALSAGSRAANSGTGGDLSAFVDPNALLSGYGLLTEGEVRHAVIFAGGDVGAEAVARRGAGPGLSGGPVVPESEAGPGTGPMRGENPGGGGLGPADSR